MKRKLIICFSFFIIFLFNVNTLLSKNEFQVTGKVIYKGSGIRNAKVTCYSAERGKYLYKEIFTNFSGEFKFFLPKGYYKIIAKKDTFVRKDLYTNISITNKNIANVLIFLDKECTITGFVRFDDGSVIPEASISIQNDRAPMPSAEIDEFGNYILKGVGASQRNTIFFMAPGITIRQKTGFILTEGTKLENVNFEIKKKLSIYGKIKDKDTKEPVEDAVAVAVYFVGKNIFIPAYQNDSGEFFFYDLPAGKYKLITLTEIYEPIFKEFFLSEDENKIINMDFVKVPVRNDN